MAQNAEILLEGSYLYSQGGVNYSQENFKLVKFSETHHYLLFAEITSRLETGEFLKVLVNYEMTPHFLGTMVRIERSIGNKYAQEIYKVDPINLELHYTFQNSQGTQDFHRSFSSKHYIATPALSSSGLFTLTKKFDATGRTAVTLVSTENDWAYQAPPSEKIVFAEFKSRDLEDFKLNNTQLAASHLCLYEFDTSHLNNEAPVELFLSKHYSIPYQLLHGERRVVIKNLKKNA